MKYKRNGLRLVLILALVMIGGMYCPHRSAYAASAVQVADVEYYNDDIVVCNNGNTKIYYALDSDAANDNWEVIPADSGRFTTIDTSWIADSTENVLMIKGDLVDTKARAVLKQKPTKLSVSINYTYLDSLASSATIAPLLNIMSTEGNSVDPITFDDLEWKKGDNGNWKNTSSLTKAVLEKYLVRGTNLFFRIRAKDDYVSLFLSGSSTAVDFNNNRIMGTDVILGTDGGMATYTNYANVAFGSDYPDGIDGRRFSEPVKLRIVKKTPSLVYNVDGEKFNAKIKYGKEYNVTATYSDGTKGFSGWIQITDKSIGSIPLATLANNLSPRQSKITNGVTSLVTFDGKTVAFPAMDIQVRDFATSKSASSVATDISLDAQRVLGTAIHDGQPSSTVTQTTDDIYVYYFGNKYILLTIPMATANLPYEYCIVKDGDAFDLQYTNWYSITKGTAVKILASRAPQDSTIYVRQKEIKSKAASNSGAAISYKLASTYVSKKLNYPSVPIVTAAQLTYTKKYSSAPQINVQLNEIGKEAFENTVKSISIGSKTIGFTTVPAAGSVINPAVVNTMTITLNKNDLEVLSNCTNRILTITFANGIVDKTSVKLTIKNSTVSSSLTLTAIAGTTAGKTKVTTISSLATGNSWVYETSATAVSGLNTDDILAGGKGTAFTSGMEITITANQYLIVYEIDANRHIIKYKSLQITSSMIKS